MPAYFAVRAQLLQGSRFFSVCDSPSTRIQVSPLARRERVDPPVPHQDETEERLQPLMIRSLEGDSGAHHQLLGMLGRYLRGYFARRIGTATAEVEDLVQETLLAVHLKRDSYDRSLPFTPWAYALARYKLIDHLRRRHRSIRSRSKTPALFSQPRMPKSVRCVPISSGCCNVYPTGSEV